VKDAFSWLLRAAIWPASDYALFLIAYRWGAPVVSAHIYAFAVTSALARLTGTRSDPTAADRPWDLRLHAELFAMTVVVVSLRGGVLALFMQSLSWTPVYAMIPAVLASQIFSRAAKSYGISLRDWKMDTGSGTRQITVALVAAALVLRLVYLGQTELLPEETYYWNYSRHLDLAYIDHPPMVAWLIRAGTAVFGDTAIGVRAGAFACNLVASYFTYRLMRDVSGVAAARVAVLLIQVLPFSFLAGMLMTPDAPLVAAWAASVYYLQRALVTGRKHAWWGVGISIGVGLLSKLTIGVLVIPGVAFALFHPRAQRWLRIARRRHLPGVSIFPRVAKWLARVWRPILVVSLALYAVGLHYLVLGVPGVGEDVQTELLPLGWRDLGRQVADVKEAIRQADGVEPLVVGMDPYMLASELAFYSPDPKRAARSTSSAHLFGGVGLMYELWFPPPLQNGKTLLLVAWNPQDLCNERIARYVGDAGPIVFGVVSRGSNSVRPFYFRVVSLYHADQLMD
jgi:hypothetical protein